MNLLSSLNRNELIEKLSKEKFQLLIIGGGITGAGIALDAASRGIKTALVEMQDFSQGTSSRSTKLIHGGLRYLKQLEFLLVSEVGRERAIVYKNAPHLVRPEKMLLPLIKGGNFSKLSTSFGLWLYDFLAGVDKNERRKMLSKEASIKEEPLLNHNTLLGAGLYTEYRTDDSRLTLEVVKTAAQFGAVSANYLKVENLIKENGKITAASCIDKLTGMKVEIQAEIVVNATGPWVDELRKTDQSQNNKRLHLTKGTHIVVPHAKLPVVHAVYFDVADGRMVFAIPRGKITYIGTTDTNYSGEINRPVATKNDVNYLIAAVNNQFDIEKLSEKDVVSSWAGLRPLIHEDGKSPSELSRKDELFNSPSGLISIAGGKLTGYRKMAKKVTDLVVKNIQKNNESTFKNSQTKNIKLCGNQFAFSNDVEKYAAKIYDELKEFGIAQFEVERLVYSYGNQTEIILSNFRNNALEANPHQRLLLAELCFSVDNESIQHLTDFFIRRTGKLYFDINSVTNHLDFVAKKMGEMLNWKDEKIRMEIAQMNKEVKESTTFE